MKTIKNILKGTIVGCGNVARISHIPAFRALKEVKLAAVCDRILFLNIIPCGIPYFSKDQCLYDNDSEVIEVIKGIPSSTSHLEVAMPKLYKREYINRKCIRPFQTLSIDAAGNITPCYYMAPRKSCGNVVTDKEIWNNSIFQEAREIFVNKTLSLRDFCKTCHGMVTDGKVEV